MDEIGGKNKASTMITKLDRNFCFTVMWFIFDEFVGKGVNIKLKK